MCNLYLARQQARVKAGDISSRHFGDCLKSCKLITDHFGKFQSASALRVADFSAFRATFPASLGPQTSTSEVTRIKSCFRWAADSELIPGIPNFRDGRREYQRPDCLCACARPIPLSGSQFPTDSRSSHTAHDWVSSNQQNFEAYLKYLKLENYRAIALRDLRDYVNSSVEPADHNAIIETRKLQLNQK